MFIFINIFSKPKLLNYYVIIMLLLCYYYVFTFYINSNYMFRLFLQDKIQKYRNMKTTEINEYGATDYKEPGLRS